MTTDIASDERGTLLEPIASRAWVQALADFYHPPLPEPLVEYQPGSSSCFYIDTKTWTVYLNVAGVPPALDANEAEPYLRSICQHEIEHYLMCPYDGIMSGMLYAAASTHLSSSLSMFVCNLFADLVVDTSLLRRFPDLTHERMRTIIYETSLMTSEHSTLWTLTVACHRTMWGLPIPNRVTIDESTYAAAQQIAEITRESLDREDKWPKAVAKIAKVVAEWLPEDEREQDAGLGSPEDSEEGVTTKTTQVPADLDAVMGSPLEVRNGDLARKCLRKGTEEQQEDEMDRLASEVEQRGGSLRDLEAVYLLAGVGPEDASWIRFWYRAKARGLIRIGVKVAKPASILPLATQVWRLGDPVEELDIVQSIQAFPLIIPNTSTRKWSTQDSGTAGTELKSCPDLLVVIDSSGSMTWAMKRGSVSGPYHTALVSAFAALDYAFGKGQRVAAVNFSDGIQSCEFTTDRREVERVLLAYQGGGTVAPVKTIRSMCDLQHDSTLVLTITDAEVANWDQLLETVTRITRRGHRFFLFCIGRADGSNVSDAVARAGGTLIPVGSISDLPGLVIGQVSQFFTK